MDSQVSDRDQGISFSFKHFPVSTLRTLRWRNDKASSARASVARTAESHDGRYLPRVHNAARTDNRLASGRDPVVSRESDKAFPAPKSDQALSAATRACMDCPAVQTARWSAPVRTPCRR